jgi:hypothetical protein
MDATTRERMAGETQTDEDFHYCGEVDALVRLMRCDPPPCGGFVLPSAARISDDGSDCPPSRTPMPSRELAVPLADTLPRGAYRGVCNGVLVHFAIKSDGDTVFGVTMGTGLDETFMKARLSAALDRADPNGIVSVADDVSFRSPPSAPARVLPFPPQPALPPRQSSAPLRPARHR